MAKVSRSRSMGSLSRGRAITALLLAGVLSLGSTHNLLAADGALLQAGFDSLRDGPLAGQDGWTAPNDMARVTQNPDGTGKVLQLNAPYGNVSRKLQSAATGLTVTEFALKMGQRSGNEFPKVLITLDDAQKKNILLFFHDSNGQWGIKNGAGWSFSKSQPAGESWRRVKITTDPKQRKSRVEIQDPMTKSWATLFKEIPFSSADAGEVAQLTLARNAQGDPAAILVDDISIGGPESAPAASVPAPVTGAVVEDFDRMTETSINGQNGWTSKQNCPIQTLFNANGGGKALDLQFPYGDAGKVFAAQGIADKATLDFKVYLPESEGDKKPKFLLSLKSADGKPVALFFHDDNANWGLQTGNGWRFSPDKTKPATWQPIRITMNLKDKKINVYAGHGSDWRLLFKDESPVDATATDVAGIQLQRNGQGAPVSVYLDDMSLSPGLLSTAQKMETSSIAAATPAQDGYSIFQPNEPVEITFSLTRKDNEPADAVAWELLDWQDKQIRSGKLDLPAGGSLQQKLTFESLPAGYYALHAKRVSNGDTLVAMGSRPRGMISFGVLPNISPVALPSGDAARFGMYGTNFIRTKKWLEGDPFDPLYGLLGIRWVEVNRGWSRHEPTAEGEYQPKVQDPSGTEGSYRAVHRLGTLVALTGIPNWAADWPAGVTPPAKESMLNHAYPPKDMNQYAAYLKKIAREQYEARKAHFPYMNHCYYMIHHEPDWHWKGTDAQFIAMYKTAHEALHAGDPDAILLGPRYGVLVKGVTELERLLPQGLGDHLDGLATHMYYLPPRLTVTPEQAGTVENFRRLQALTRKYLKPNAPMAQMEWGVRYVGAYDEMTPEIFRQHASQFVRGHIIALGEGMDLTFLFYSSDYTGEAGYGVTFNLTMPEPNFGAIATSPKPTAMAIAAMTRLLDGTKTIGPIASKPEIMAYSFKRGNQIVTAMWAPQAAQNRVESRWTVADKTVQLFDTMGNSQDMRIVNGKLSVPLGIEPVYVLSTSAIASDQ